MIRPVLIDFTAGELSPRLAGRVDLPVFYKGAQELTNFYPRSIGGIYKRPGSGYVAETRNGLKARLIPWTIDEDTVFLIELTAGAIRFFHNGALVLSSGVPTLITTTILEEELPAIKYAQSHREVWLVHPNHAPIWFKYKEGSTPAAATFEYDVDVQHFAGNAIEWVAPVETPYETWDLWEQIGQWLVPRKTYTASGTFNGKTVASVERVELSLVVMFSDATTLTMTRGTDYSYQGSITMDLRPFMGAGNYPGAIAIFAGRLWLGGSLNDPDTLWGSKPWDYTDFTLFETVEYTASEPTLANRTDHTGATTQGNTTISSISPALVAGAMVGKYITGANVAYGAKVVSNTTNSIVMDMAAIATGPTTPISFSDWKDANVPEYTDVKRYTQQIGAANAVRLKLATEEDERILWIAAGQDLFIGTSSSEWAIPGTSNATQARAQIVSRYGSGDVQGRFVGAGIAYVSPSSRHVRQFGSGQTLTLQADHIVKPGVVQLDFQQVPDVALWCVLANGELVRCLIDGGTQTVAWSRVRMRAGDLVESVAVAPGADRDFVYVVVRRTINGATKRFIEVLRENEDDTLEAQWYLDAAVQKTGASFTTITGLTHLAGQAVKVRRGTTLQDATVEDVTVDGSGVATISASTYALVGLPFTSRAITQRIEGPDSEGLSKQVGRVFFRLFRSNAFTIRHTTDLSAPSVPVSITPCYTGAYHVTAGMPSLEDMALVIDSDDPVPLGIQTIVPETTIGG